MMVPLAINDSEKVSKRVYEDLIMIGGNLAKIKPSTGWKKTRAFDCFVLTNKDEVDLAESKMDKRLIYLEAIGYFPWS